MVSADCFLSPPKAGRLLGCGPDQVLAFIRAGELRASNLSRAGRPRWKIAPADLQKFLDARSNQKPASQRQRRRAESTSVREYV